MYNLIYIFQNQYPELFTEKYIEIMKEFDIDFEDKEKAHKQINELLEGDTVFTNNAKEYLALIDDNVKLATAIIKESYKKIIV